MMYILEQAKDAVNLNFLLILLLESLYIEILESTVWDYANSMIPKFIMGRRLMTDM